VEIAKGKFGDREFFDVCPDIMQWMQDIITDKGFRGVNNEVRAEVVNHRYVLLAFVTGWMLDLPKAERLELIAVAKRRNFAQWLWGEL
jgi:hypothetical protein